MWRRRELKLKAELEQAKVEAESTEELVQEARKETARARDFTDANHLIALVETILAAPRPRRRFP